MSQGTAPQKPAKPKSDREDRLKAALKANMARRKAQARARGAKEQTDNGPDGQDKES
jgi:hypothetical protein